MNDHYDPEGFEFYDMNSQRQMKLVVDIASPHHDWVCFRHPDGQWVTLRKATEDEINLIIERAKIIAGFTDTKPLKATDDR